MTQYQYKNTKVLSVRSTFEVEFRTGRLELAKKIIPLLYSVGLERTLTFGATSYGDIMIIVPIKDCFIFIKFVLIQLIFKRHYLRTLIFVNFGRTLRKGIVLSSL